MDDTTHTDDPSERGDQQPIDKGEPIGTRVDHDPSNLGNDIPDEGDLTHPAPINQPLGKAPGM